MIPDGTNQLKHMVDVRPDGLDRDAVRWALTEIEQLRRALRIFVGCAYPVSKKIDPRGYGWRPEKDLDYALDEARDALHRD